MTRTLRILGIDPGLARTGWGLVEARGSHLSHRGHGVFTTTAATPLAERLETLFDALAALIDENAPDCLAVEETFVNRDPRASLSLGHARAMALLAGARARLPVAEYAPNLVKKSVVGTGHADKAQIRRMIGVLLPAAEVRQGDAADALAIAITHAHLAGAPARLAAAGPAS